MAGWNGHGRPLNVGLEDNIYYSKGFLPKQCPVGGKGGQDCKEFGRE
jgi:hypothetical protein